MNKLSKEKRDRLILICILIAGIVGGLYTFVLGAQKEELATLQTQITGAKSKVDKADVLVRSSATIEARLTEAKKLIDSRQEKMAPPGQYYYWFLKLIDQFRKDEKLDTSFIVDITQPEFVEGGLLPRFPYRAASFGLRLNGHFHDIGKFVAAVENAYPYFRVQNIRITPHGIGAAATKQPQPVAKLDNTEGKLTVELKIVTLIKPGTT
jgi:Tfp pilus assembly protein PilO